jgi:HEAT repeat protein
MPLPAPSQLDGTPAARIAELSGHLGREQVALRCVELLRGTDPASDSQLLRYLGGRHADRVLAGADRDYWPRVWAARALRYAWTPSAAPAVVDALADPAWRVAEMATKVAWLHEVGEAVDGVVPLTEHELPRVRTAAVRALGRLGEHEHVHSVLELVDDPDPGVRRAAQRALRLLEQRLDIEPARLPLSPGRPVERGPHSYSPPP